MRVMPRIAHHAVLLLLILFLFAWVVRLVLVVSAVEKGGHLTNAHMAVIAALFYVIGAVAAIVFECKEHNGVRVIGLLSLPITAAFGAVAAAFIFAAWPMLVCISYAENHLPYTPRETPPWANRVLFRCK